MSILHVFQPQFLADFHLNGTRCLQIGDMALPNKAKGVKRERREAKKKDANEHASKKQKEESEQNPLDVCYCVNFLSYTLLWGHQFSEGKPNGVDGVDTGS